MKNCLIVFTTVPRPSVGRKIAGVLLKSRLVACVHLVPQGESIYWWKGKLERAREGMVVIKTSKKSLPKLMQILKKNHPYEVPEILAVRVDQGFRPYIDWIFKETN